MKIVFAAVALAATLLLAGCEQEQLANAPAPFALTADAMGRYCGMNVLEHPGPKGQVILAQIPEAIWFSSARDTIAFTMLPEEPRDIAAIYVSDMGKAPSWEEPGAENWVDARTAFYVLGSTMRGGMGNEEAVPFSGEADAQAFAGKNGGRVVRFADIPKEYVLGGTGETAVDENPELEPASSEGKGQDHG